MGVKLKVCFAYRHQNLTIKDTASYTYDPERSNIVQQVLDPKVDPKPQQKKLETFLSYL